MLSSHILEGSGRAPLPRLGDSRKLVSPRHRQSATAFTQIDFDRLGRQIGFVHIPQSPHDDAWGTVRVPIAVLANGSGPTVALEAGNHGDEYEGRSSWVNWPGRSTCLGCKAA